MDKYILEYKWTVSRGRESYGYNICSLYVDGKKVSSCNGGGYDMKGTALGNWIARKFEKELLALKPEDMPEQSHWERNAERNVYECECKKCKYEFRMEISSELPTCPICKNSKDMDVSIVYGTLGMNDGKRVVDGRYFYGLSFHDPDYDPGKAVIGENCTDRTITKDGEAIGMTVEEAEKEGKSLGLERYQAFYSASSKTPTERHIVPLIGGACGISSVEAIMKAIGCRLEFVSERSKSSTYILRCGKEREGDE